MFEIVAIAAGALAIFVGGLLKGVVGMGAPLFAIPILVAVYGVPTALAVMTLPLAVSNLWQMWSYRRATEGRKALHFMLAGGIIGIVLGTALLGLVPEAWLATTLGVLLLVYLAVHLARPEFNISEPAARRAALPVGVVTGVMQGAAGVSTPVSVTFIHSQRLPREAHLFAVSSIFTIMAVAQVVALSAAGIMDLRLAATSVAAVVPIMVGVWLGQILGDHVSRQVFERLTLVVLFLVAVGLLARSMPLILS